MTTFQIFFIFVPSSEGGWGKLKFWYLGKVKKFQINTCMRYGAIVISPRGFFKK